MTSKFVLPLAVALGVATPSLTSSAAAQTPPGTAASPDALPTLTMAQASGLRCAAAFGIVVQQQRMGLEDALRYPPLAERGREFFVRVLAQLMDDTGASRTQLAQMVDKEVEGIQRSGELGAMMPPCLQLLETSEL